MRAELIKSRRRLSIHLKSHFETYLVSMVETSMYWMPFVTSTAKVTLDGSDGRLRSVMLAVVSVWRMDQRSINRVMNREMHNTDLTSPSVGGDGNELRIFIAYALIDGEIDLQPSANRQSWYGAWREVPTKIGIPEAEDESRSRRSREKTNRLFGVVEKFFFAPFFFCRFDCSSPVCDLTGLG
jgi:hypothetical protein